MTISKAREGYVICPSNLLRWLALAAAVCTAGLASSVAAKTLKIATVSPDGSSWMKTLRRAGGDLDAATEGRLTLKFYPGGTMGDDASVLKRMRVGQLHGGLVLTTTFANIYPDVQVYNLPMVFQNLEEVDSVRQAMDPALMDGFRDHGFLALGLSEVGMAYPMGTRPARSVADARKLKVWAPQGDAAAVRMLQAFDITPIQMPIGEVLTGLSTGMIDTVASPPVATLPLLWHTRLKFVLDLPLMYVYGTLVVSERALRGVKSEDVAALESIVGAAMAETDRQNRADHDEARQVLADQGLAFIDLTATQLAEWRRNAAVARADWVDEGVISSGIHDTIVARLTEIRAEL